MPDLRDSLVNSLIGAGSAVDGDLEVEGMLRVDGDLRGSVRATGKIVVGAAGRVDASIRAQSAIIGGLVKGDVYVSDYLRLLSGGIIIGNVYAPRIEVEDNTYIHGDVEVSGDAGRSEEKITAFVERHGGASRFLGRFRGTSFAVPSGQESAPRPLLDSLFAASVAEGALAGNASGGTQGGSPPSA
jgi:cytoskeletal protein CcmA (bactofilin family)